MKQLVTYEVNINIDNSNAKVDTIADIIVQFYEDALLQVHPWHEVPMAHVIVTSDEATVKKMAKQLEQLLGWEVSYREAPYYLYE